MRCPACCRANGGGRRWGRGRSPDRPWPNRGRGSWARRIRPARGAAPPSPPCWSGGGWWASPRENSRAPPWSRARRSPAARCQNRVPWWPDTRALSPRYSGSCAWGGCSWRSRSRCSRWRRGSTDRAAHRSRWCCQNAGGSAARPRPPSAADIPRRPGRSVP